jgi:hypothetical protein
MMLPDLVTDERLPVSAAGPPGRLTLVRFDGDTAHATPPRPHLRLCRAAKVIGIVMFAILAGTACLVMLVGVVINLLGATP